MKKIEINGRTFDVHKSSKVSEDLAIRNTGKELWHYYDSFSRAKGLIYEDWRSWYCNSENVSNFGVCSANSNTFSLSALYSDDLHDYLLVITKAYNKAYILA